MQAKYPAGKNRIRMLHMTITPNRFQPQTRHDTDMELEQRAGVSSVNDVTQEFLAKLAESKDAGSRILAARFHGTSLDVLNALAGEHNPHVRCAVTTNTSASPAIIAKALAPELHPNIIHRLRHQKIRTQLFNAVCAHATTDLDTLRVLLKASGPKSPAGRYSNERLILAETAKRIAVRKAEHAAARDAARAELAVA